jgi:outer membrane receptor protein involved in Fe transport
MSIFVNRGRACLYLGCSLLALSPTAALAQSASGAATGSAAKKAETEEIVVVGSRIEGAKISGALPISVLGEDRILATGSVSGDDLFRSLPQAGDVQFQEARTTGNLNDARGDNASINLRSVGTGNTLVLLNGRRMILTPGTQTENFVPVQTVNTNSIPVGATRRVEVLRDGAAAIYGADAVAGVVNVVLDNKFTGLRAMALLMAPAKQQRP